MSSSFWNRFPPASDIRCVEMKDRLQDRVSRETRNASPDELVAYFRNAARRFWQQMGRPIGVPWAESIQHDDRA